MTTQATQTTTVLPTIYGTYSVPGLDCLAYYDQMSQMWLREDTGEWIRHEHLAALIAKNGCERMPDATPTFRAGSWHKS